MRATSKAYEIGMEKPIRERSYAMVKLSLIDRDVQSKAVLQSNNLELLSAPLLLFKDTFPKDVITLENNHAKLNGGLVFKKDGIKYPFVSTPVLPVSMTISLHKPTTVKGLTVDFSESYPTSFQIKGEGKTLTVDNNESQVFITDVVFENVTKIEIIVTRMKNDGARVRIKSIKLGYVLTFDGEKITRLNVDNFASVITEKLPQIDLQVQIINENDKYSVDNPNSVIHSLKEGMEIDTFLGLEVEPNNIEWLKLNHLVSSGFESDKNVFTIKATDSLRNLESEYDGREGEGINFYTLLEDIFRFSDFRDYYIDPYLKHYSTKNLIPKMKCKELIQVIANASKSRLSIDEHGILNIKPFFIPKITMSSSANKYPGKINAIITEKMIPFAVLDEEYLSLSGENIFKPTQFDKASFVSAEKADNMGVFENKPKIVLTADVARLYHMLKISFSNNYAIDFSIKAYKNNALVESVDVTGNSEKTRIEKINAELDKIEIEFTKGKINRSIEVLELELNDVSSFVMSKNNMLSDVSVYEKQAVKDVEIVITNYTKGTSTETIIQESITVGANEERTIPFYTPISEMHLNTANVEILKSSPYMVKLKFRSAGTYNVVINGKRYIKRQSSIQKQVSNQGNTVKWNNPLIDTIEKANEVFEFIKPTLKYAKEYSYATRGNPEIDTLDKIYQQNDYKQNMKVIVTEQRLTFDGALSSNMKTITVGE